MSRNLDRLSDRLGVSLEARSADPVVEHPARAALLDEFRALGQALDLGVHTVHHGGLALSRGAHTLVLLPDHGGAIRLAYPGAGDEQLVRDPTGSWLWRSKSGSAYLNNAGVEGLIAAAFDLPDPGEAEKAAAEAEKAQPRGPRDGEVGHMGRSGTRGFKRAKDLPPGSVVKDLKGPLG